MGAGHSTQKQGNCLLKGPGLGLYQGHLRHEVSRGGEVLTRGRVVTDVIELDRERSRRALQAMVRTLGLSLNMVGSQWKILNGGMMWSNSCFKKIIQMAVLNKDRIEQGWKQRGKIKNYCNSPEKR